MQMSEAKPERVESASERGCRLEPKGDLSAKDAKGAKEGKAMHGHAARQRAKDGELASELR